MSPAKHDNHDALVGFLEFQFGTDTPGQVRLAVMEGGAGFREFMATWPAQKDTIADWFLSQSSQGKDVYYTPALFLPPEKAVSKNEKGKTRGVRENVMSSQVVWVDLDGNAPENWKTRTEELGIPGPSLIIQSSVKGNEHVYWRLDRHHSADEIEDINRSLGLAVGADQSGWDGTQLLRPPFTRNGGFRGNGSHKDWFKGEPVEVTIQHAPDPQLRVLDDFVPLAKSGNLVQERVRNSLSDLPTVFDVLTGRVWPDTLKRIFQYTQQEASDASPDKRSGTLQRLAYEAVEAGFNDESVYVIIEDADRRWEKYIKRQPAKREKILLDVVARARVRAGVNVEEFANFLPQEVEGADDINLYYGLEDFMAADVPPVEWIFKGLVAKESIGFFTAQPGVGKTQYTLNTAICAALGRKFLEFDATASQLKVLYMSLEMNHTQLRDFLSKILTGESEENMRLLQKNLALVPSDKIESMPLDKKEGQNLFESMFLEKIKPDLIIIDSLTEIISKSISDDETALEVMKYLRRLTARFHTTVAVIHHNRKLSSEAKNRAPLSLSDMYGSQWYGAKADFVTALQKTGEIGVLNNASMKMRQAKDFQHHIKRSENLTFELHDKDAQDSDLLIEEIGGFKGVQAPGDSTGSSSESDRGTEPPVI